MDCTLSLWLITAGFHQLDVIDPREDETYRTSIRQHSSSASFQQNEPSDRQQSYGRDKHRSSLQTAISIIEQQESRYHSTYSNNTFPWSIDGSKNVRATAKVRPCKLQSDTLPPKFYITTQPHLRLPWLRPVHDRKSEAFNDYDTRANRWLISFGVSLLGCD